MFREFGEARVHGQKSLMDQPNGGLGLDSPEGGALLHVDRQGGGEQACVLVHGIGEGAYVWSDFVANLPPRFSSFAVDLRGHGRSPWSTQYSFDQHCADLTATIASLHTGPCILIGHSIGGAVATQVAVALRDRIAALVVVDFGPDPRRSVGKSVLRNFRNSQKEYATAEEYVEELSRRCPLASTDMVRRWAGEALEVGTGGGLRVRVDPAAFFWRKGRIESDLKWDLLRRVACPTLIVRGAGSAVLPKQIAERMLNEIPDCHLRTIQKAGHTVMLDNPVEFRQAVIGFIEQLREPPAQPT